MGQLSQFHVGELSARVTEHPLWEGSILQQKHSLGLLMWADLRHDVREKLRLPDLTPDERELCNALWEASQEWEKQWEFD